MSGDRWKQGLASGLHCQAQEQAGAAGSKGQEWEQESQAEGQGKGGVCGAGRAGGWGEAGKLVLPSGVKTAAEKRAKQRN